MASDNTTAKKIRWVPLESSPDALGRYIHRLGASKSSGFSDVWGLDDELLAMVPQPVRSVIFLFPYTDKYVENRNRLLASSTAKVSPNVWFMRQTIGNACGTMAVFHSLGNNLKEVPVTSHLAEFFEKVKDMTPAERAANFETNEAIAVSHSEAATDTRSTAPSADDEVNNHYVAFVAVDGDLYELDGTVDKPINHGPTTDLLKDAAKVIKERIAFFDGESQEFSVISFGPNISDD
ncbi:Ubiquitin carboxyl-terminal hydrolase isozyme L3 [Coemansia sp. Benny D115]|nr:Ubiquitin carboxyl-terminal hydrolase isozyme L3 [Coemansia sp. Benny D115]